MSDLKFSRQDSWDNPDLGGEDINESPAHMDKAAHRCSMLKAYRIDTVFTPGRNH